jgi:hypothetical protein
MRVLLVLASVLFLVSCVSSSRFEALEKRADELEIYALRLGERLSDRSDDLRILEECASRGRRDEMWYWWRCDLPSGVPAAALTLEASLGSRRLDAEDEELQVLRNAADLGSPYARRDLIDRLTTYRAELNPDTLEAANLLEEILFWEWAGVTAHSREAQLRLACRYWTGNGIPRSEKRAAIWMFTASAHGDPRGSGLLVTLARVSGMPYETYTEALPPDALERELRVLRSLDPDASTLEDAQLLARNPIWVSCLAETPGRFADWWVLTGAPPIDPDTDRLFAYRDAVDALVARPTNGSE